MVGLASVMPLPRAKLHVRLHVLWRVRATSWMGCVSGGGFEPQSHESRQQKLKG